MIQSRSKCRERLALQIASSRRYSLETIQATMPTSARLAGAMMILLATSADSTGNFCGTTAGCIYPLPTHATQGTPTVRPPTLDPNRFSTSCVPTMHPGCSTVIAAFERMRDRVFIRRSGIQFDNTSLVTQLVVRLQSPTPTELQHGIDESYTLTVPAAAPAMTVVVSAMTEWGALHGIESFTQSLRLTPGTTYGFFTNSTPAYVLQLWPPAQVSDSPRTSWRGLLIDTSRCLPLSLSGYDQIKGTQDKDFSYSFSDSLSLSGSIIIISAISQWLSLSECLREILTILSLSHTVTHRLIVYVQTLPVDWNHPANNSRHGNGEDECIALAYCRWAGLAVVSELDS